MSIYCMPFTIFVQFALESLASIDVQIKSMDCYFFTVECLHSDSSSDPQHFQIFALASKVDLWVVATTKCGIYASSYVGI